MTNNESRKVSFLVGDGQDKADNALADSKSRKLKQFKKPLIFALMGIVFFSCMYLIFKPKDSKKAQDAGLNESVPQATDAGLASDKQKAYEQEQLEKKQQEQRNGLASLSDYWNEDSAGDSSTTVPEQELEDEYSYVRGSTTGYVRGATGKGNAALNSYRYAQNTLGSFYEDNNSETQELRKQIEELKEQLAEKNIPQPATVDDQMALMEKSYQLAAKYLPSGSSTTQPKADTAAAVRPSSEQGQFAPVAPAHKRVVSALYREPTDSAFFASLEGDRNWDFYTATTTGRETSRSGSSTRASVQHTQVVTSESDVVLRLLEPAKTPAGIIPPGTEVTAQARLQGGRLQLKVNAIQWEGSVIPVDITVYGLDGQQGLLVPYSPEMNALTEIASNMAQTSGTSIMMTRSASQQVAGDLSRGLVQGISGYFSKKIRTPKVTLKAGYQVLLVPKK